MYKCGVHKGQTLRLKTDLKVRDANGSPTGEVFRQGEVWEVLSPSPIDPGTVWLLRADGLRQTWSDDLSIFDQFEHVG